MNQCTCVTRCGKLRCRLKAWRLERLIDHDPGYFEFPRETVDRIVSELAPICRKKKHNKWPSEETLSEEQR